MFGWCWHRWGPWSDVVERTSYYSGGKVYVQTRTCTKCNQLKSRIS